MGQERDVKVGILKAREVRVVFHSAYLLDGKPFVGEHCFTPSAEERLFVPAEQGASFTLKDVVIGIGFHWERKEEQTFCGALLLKMEEGQVRAINVVPVETYLTSVISSEMSANASLELLKAHAVISRSWLMVMMEGRRKKEEGRCQLPTARYHEQLSENSIIRWYDSEAHTGFDVCADDHCQRYQGLGGTVSRNARRAVDQTWGEVLCCDGELCDTRFSKCCGGVTELFSTCWEDKDFPYLKSVPDTPEEGGDAFCNTENKEILSQVLNDYDLETRDFYRWKVKYSREELSALVARRSGIDFGDIESLQPVERGPSGRIKRLLIQGSKRTMTVGKELTIRRFLSESHLKSSAFDIECEGDNFILNGKGWGHGVGLCQIGAAVMASRGYDYKQILEHYYPGLQLKRR